MNDVLPLPDGFSVGHWTDTEAETGCTVVIPPPGTPAGVDVRGGGPGTRETDGLSPLAGGPDVTAVLLTGGSAFGLAAADGVMRWLEERGMGRATPAGPVPIVPAAVVYDLATGRGDVRPGPEAGYAASQAARGGVPQRGRVGAGAGAAVAKLFGREGATRAGVGYAARRLGTGERVAAIAVANAAGDVIGPAGELLAGPRGPEGRQVRSAEAIAEMAEPPGWTQAQGNTTLVCVVTDAALGKRGCGMVARTASAGIARAVDPTFTPVDGDVVFCLASGGEPLAGPWPAMVVGTVAATVTAEAIRDALR
jgi:L-aminopeptidase/D-esterase-like protein